MNTVATSMITDRLPDIEEVDFSDPADISGYVALMCRKGGELGMYGYGFKPSRESNRLKQTSNRLVRRLDERLPHMAPADAFSIMTPYDMAHRLAYGQPADRTLTNRYILSAFTAMIGGDTMIDEYTMHREISGKIRQRDRVYFDKPLSWYTTSIDRWFKTIDTAAQPDYDTISRVSILLTSDMYVFVGKNETAYKQTLFDTHRHYLTAHDASDPHTLSAVGKLLNASSPFLTPGEYTACSTLLTDQLIANPATNRFHRAALLPTPIH